MPELHRKQREFTRVHVPLTVQVAAADGASFEAPVRDLSMKGLYAAAPLPLRVGDPCRLELALGRAFAGLQIEIGAVVVRSEPTGTAVEFRSASLDDYEHLTHVVLLNAPDPARIEKELEAHPLLRRDKRNPLLD